MDEGNTTHPLTVVRVRLAPLLEVPSNQFETGFVAAFDADRFSQMTNNHDVWRSGSEQFGGTSESVECWQTINSELCLERGLSGHSCSARRVFWDMSPFIIGATLLSKEVFQVSVK